jgi:hypothetical protein
VWQTHCVTDLPPWLALLQSRVDNALLSGAWAASCAAYERDGRVEFVTRTNREVLATIRFQAPGETAMREWRCSFGAAPFLAASGARIEKICGPDNDAIGWAATAIINSAGRLPAFPVRLPPIARDRWWVVVCSDFRGASALPLSRVPMSEIGGRPFGEALLDAVARTTIPGLRTRIQRERTELGDGFAITAATAAAEVFNTPEGMAGADDGLPTLEWQVFSRGFAENDWTTVAISPAGATSSRTPGRRARIHAAVQKQAQEDALGAGVHSPRSIWNIVSLETRVGPSDESPSLGELLPAKPDLGSGIEIDDLLAAADLTSRERDVVELLLKDLTQQEIAKRLGIKPGTVAALSSRAKQKLRQGRSKT